MSEMTSCLGSSLGLNEAPKSNSSNMESFHIYVVTWNVGGRFPDNISLRQLLGLHNIEEHSNNDCLPSIYAIGLQEVSIQPHQQVMGLFKEDPWTNKAKKLLQTYDYVLVKTEQMQGLLLSIFVRRSLVEHLRDMEAEFTRTGFGGVWGNKGAVSIRFTLYGSGLVFVVAHFAAHDHHLDERIDDYKQILEHHHYHVLGYREIYDHDYVFWFGDLNFRLLGNDSATDIQNSLLKNKLSQLIKLDELCHLREETKEAFQVLQETRPDFPPTFKFKEGTSEYDMKRRPAWTDRIMYAAQPRRNRSTTQLTIVQNSYKSHSCYTISDHKPVTSGLTITLNSNYRSPVVHFAPITVWRIGDENTVEYYKPLEFPEGSNDWIGIFPIAYTSLRDYIAYEYVNQAESASSNSDHEEQYFDTPVRHRSSRHHHRQQQRLNRKKDESKEQVRINFADDIELRHGQQYMLIYFQNTGFRRISSIAGMSIPFVAEKREGSPYRIEYNVD